MSSGSVQPIGGSKMNANSQSYNQGQNENRPNIWYKLVSMGDYEKISQIGEIVISLRILPSVSQGQCVYPIVEKDVSRTQFPNTPKWLMPVLVLNDPLEPSKNGFVGVCEISKSLNDIIEKKSPNNFYHPVNGYNFNVHVTIKSFNDGKKFPSYANSYFDDQPTPIEFNPIGQYLQQLELLDFGVFVNRINNPQSNNQAPQMGQRFVATPSPQPQPAATFTQSTPQPNVTYAPSQNNVPTLGGVATFNPQQQTPTQNATSAPPPAPKFDDVFGSGDSIPF